MSQSTLLTDFERRTVLQFYTIEQIQLTFNGIISNAQAMINVINFSAYLTRDATNSLSLALEDLRLVVVGEGFLFQPGLFGTGILAGRGEGQFFAG